VTTKTRRDYWRNGEVGSWWYGNHTSPPTPPVSTQFGTARGDQELLYSEGNAHHKLGESLSDIGGPFSVVRREYSERSFFCERARTTTNNNASLTARNYRGQFYAERVNVDDQSFEAPVHATNLELDAMGTTAIARVIPTNPISGLTTALAEVKREGLPSILGHRTWQERALRARNAGDEYLNYQFGWVPLLNEIRDFARVVTDHDKIIAQYEQGSGKPIRRRFTFPIQETTSTTTVDDVVAAPEMVVTYWSNRGVRTIVTTSKVETWFSGCFTYYLPPFDPNGTNRERNLQIANKLFGVRVTPKVLWDLTPWTWAADWIANTGDVLHNISAFQQDGLVMRWGYVMRKHTITRDVGLSSVRMTWINGQTNWRIPYLQQVFVTTTKSRRKATPYGFGLNPDSFSNRQWAILTALGLSKSGRSLG
jgi:hypothetical protein